MSLNLSNSVRNSNPYLSEIDRLGDRVETLETVGQELTVSLTGSGAAGVADKDFILSHDEKTVHICMPAELDFTVDDDTNDLSFTAFPIQYHPNEDLFFVIHGKVDTAETIFVLTITNAGVMSIGNIGAARTFTIANVVKVSPFSVSYRH